MKHEITLDEVIKSLNQEIIITACGSAKKRASKSLSFNPSTLKYRVKHIKTGSGMQTSNSYLDPLVAIGKYNDYDV